VPLFSSAAATLPLRVLVGTNMPAVLVELGFLTNAADEKALAGTDRPSAIVGAILDTIGDMRPDTNIAGLAQ
jgi:N-acetylmuramoyl-L-alanine amidase